MTTNTPTPRTRDPRTFRRDDKVRFHSNRATGTVLHVGPPAINAETGNPVIEWREEPGGAVLHHDSSLLVITEYAADVTSPAAEKAMGDAVAREVAAHYGVLVTDLFTADHTHECLTPGSASVAWEGDVREWAVAWPESRRGRATARKLGVRFEPVTGCVLAIRPEEKSSAATDIPRDPMHPDLAACGCWPHQLATTGHRRNCKQHTAPTPPRDTAPHTAVQQAARAINGADGTVHPLWNGRGMWSGDTCLGVTVSTHANVSQFLVELAIALIDAEQPGDPESGADVARRLTGAAQTEPTGYGVAVYFPGWGTHN